MKRLSLSFLCLLLFSVLSAQKYDYHWLIGYYNVSLDTPLMRRVNDLDFHTTPVQLSLKARPLMMLFAAANMSDESGSLIFYTDGLQINDIDDHLMLYGDSLNPGKVRDDYIEAGFYPSPNGTIILNTPGEDSVYQILHVPAEYGGPDNMFFDGLLQTTVDMRQNLGLGAVVAKNVRILSDSLSGADVMACKHANGRDWWIVVRDAWTNCFNELLLTPSGVDSMGRQCIGDSTHKWTDRGYGVFTPDGSKCLWATPFEGLNILDFDRCTGKLSNYVYINAKDSFTLLTGNVYLNGISVSPNSRYAYLSTESDLRQYDLWATNIAASEIKIANTYNSSPTSSISFSMLAPDGRIYIAPRVTDTMIHVILNPDAAGASCLFEKNSFNLVAYNYIYLPRFPNYRLGPLSGSGCDTLQTGITNLTANNNLLTVYPNPTNSNVTFDYGYLNWNKGEATLYVYDLAGRLQHTQPLPQYSALQKLNIQQWPAGVYQAVIKQSGTVTAKARFSKE